MMAKTWAEISESYDFNRAALAKQRLQNLRHAGRKVRGARIANLLRAAGIHENTEIDEELITQLDEVLTKDTSVDKWIHDFVNSSNPKFEGKSKKERIKMALGAYYAKQRNEEVEQVEEGITSVYHNIMAKRAGKKADHAYDMGDEKEFQKQVDKTEYHRVKAGGKPTRINTNPDSKMLTTREEKLQEDIWSIANTKTGQVYHYSKYPVNSSNETLKKIRAAGGDHVHATPHKNGKPVNEETMKDKEDLPFDPDPKSNFKKPHNPSRSGMDTARALAQKALQRQKQEKVNEGSDGPVSVKVQADKEPHEEKWEAAKKKVRKEEYDADGNVVYEKLTYKEFMLEYTPGPGGVTRIQGRGYGNAKGAKYGNTDYDSENLDKSDDEGESNQPQKRGRGRPAGSKSGARGPRIK